MSGSYSSVTVFLVVIAVVYSLCDDEEVSAKKADNAGEMSTCIECRESDKSSSKMIDNVYIKQIEKHKNEVLEGLQIEEEGLISAKSQIRHPYVNDMLEVSTLRKTPLQVDDSLASATYSAAKKNHVISNNSSNGNENSSAGISNDGVSSYNSSNNSGGGVGGSGGSCSYNNCVGRSSGNKNARAIIVPEHTLDEYEKYEEAASGFVDNSLNIVKDKRLDFGETQLISPSDNFVDNYRRHYRDYDRAIKTKKKKKDDKGATPIGNTNFSNNNETNSGNKVNITISSSSNINNNSGGNSFSEDDDNNKNASGTLLDRVKLRLFGSSHANNNNSRKEARSLYNNKISSNLESISSTKSSNSRVELEKKDDQRRLYKLARLNNVNDTADGEECPAVLSTVAVNNNSSLKTAEENNNNQMMIIITEEEKAEMKKQEEDGKKGRFGISRSRMRRAATARKERIWDHAVIPYEIDTVHFTSLHVALFKQAMRHWENYTCIKFVERVPKEHPNYIIFTERPCGCCSFVGKRGNGAQAISIGKNCDKFGIVVHELGHVVGFWHEHTRPDRDNHVQIVRDHIITGQEYNFNKLTEEDVNSLGLPYDYDSIMHYARNTFSKGTYLDTIYPIDKSHPFKKVPDIGQRIRLSEGDIAQTSLLYKCPRCGRTMLGDGGNFSHYQMNANGSVKCEWRIIVSHGETVRLNISDIDIHRSSQCSTDYLEIRDGYWHQSELIGRYCGNGRIQDLVTTKSNRMLVTYVSSGKDDKMRGFTASYEAICGGVLFVEHSKVGRIESPNFPDDYQSNRECIWILTADQKYQIALKFQTFEVENHDNCAYDYLELHNGDNADSPLIDVFCGYKLPRDVRSSGNKLYMKFVTDGTVQKMGFTALYMTESDECLLTDHGCEQICINTLGGYECACKIGYQLRSDNKRCEESCGGKVDVTSGTISSPSFPEMYPGNRSCIWEIVAPQQHRILLNFTHFDLEGNNIECEYDKVEVYSKIMSDHLVKHGAFCGNQLPPVILSDKNILRVEFESDSTIHKSGFLAIFFTDMDECSVNNGGCQHGCQNTIGSYQCFCQNGFVLHENGRDCKEGGCKHDIRYPKGMVTSPNYPDYYPNKKDCTWHFIATPGHRIELVFSVLDLEPNERCSYDHVTLYDGDSTESLMLGRFCGTKIPPPVVSSANLLYVLFKSDATVQGKGFVATHSTVCGGKLRASNRLKHFYSHATYGDSSYEHDVNCEWVIEADYGWNIRLSFLNFDLEAEKECIYDFVEVYGSSDTSGQFFGKFCGNSAPSDVISVSDTLLVHFSSDNNVANKGFSASYIAVEPIIDDGNIISHIGH